MSDRRDPQPTLFDDLELRDPDVAERACGACHVRRYSRCAYDLDREAGAPLAKRPRSCLRSYDPAVAAIPY